MSSGRISFRPKVGFAECAGINRHVVGDERALQERRVANPFWPRVLQADIARCRLKRRQRYQWAGLLSFEKPMDQDADSVPVREEGNTTTTLIASGLIGPA